MKRLAAIACAAAVSTGGAAAASVPAIVTLAPATCARRGLDHEAFARLLRIELLADGVTEVRVAEAPPAVRARGESLAVVSIEGGCGDDPDVTVVIDDAATDKSVRRAIALADVPIVARPRALALAAAELLRASWIELALPDVPPPRVEIPPAMRASASRAIARDGVAPPPVAAPVRAEPPARVPVAPRSAHRPWLVSATVEGRHFFGGSAFVLGGRAALSRALPGPFRLRATMGGAAGSAADTLGRIDLALATGTLGLDVSLGVFRDLRIDIGPDLEIGWGHAGGAPKLATTAVIGGATWIAMSSVTAAARARLSGRVWATAEMGFGAVLRGLTATSDGRAAAGLSGAMGSARIGVAFEL